MADKDHKAFAAHCPIEEVKKSLSLVGGGGCFVGFSDRVRDHKIRRRVVN